MDNNNEEMRKMLKEMSDYPHDVFDYGCTSFGEAAEWALKTIDAQQAEIERLKPKKGKWIFTGQKNAYGGTVIQCPFCDDKYAAADPSYEHFCRNCGAKLMD